SGSLHRTAAEPFTEPAVFRRKVTVTVLLCPVFSPKFASFALMEKSAGLTRTEPLSVVLGSPTLVIVNLPVADPPGAMENPSCCGATWICGPGTRLPKSMHTQ